MAGNVSIRFEMDVSPTLAMLARIGGRFDDYSDAFEHFETTFHEIMAAQFATEGVMLGGKKWSPLTPAYAAWKEKNYPGKKILDRTGDMMRSFTGTSEGTVKVIGTHSAEFGSSVKYARYHQTGTRKMKARPIIEVNPALTNELARMIFNHLTGAGLDDDGPATT